jgi:hypothetical protein
MRTTQAEEPHICADGSYVRSATLEEIVLAYLRRETGREAA